ncbi:MAG: nickel-binding protein [Stenomitos frigidus ULC029]
MLKPEGIQLQRNPTLFKVAEGTYPPFSDEDWNEANRQLLACYVEQGIEWIQSYISLDRTKVITELNAPDIKSIQAVQRKGRADLSAVENREWRGCFSVSVVA